MFLPMWSSLGVKIIGRGNCCRKQDMQHNTQQERTQPTNSNPHAHRRDSHINNIRNETEDSSFLVP
jgi:hypothetical protein